MAVENGGESANMISSFKLSGTGGRLVPFFKSVLLYFTVTGGLSAPAGLAALKCLPVLCLAAFLVYPRARDSRYCRRLLAGLLCSAVGDACLEWPGGLAVGMLAFAMAHGWFMAAFGWKPIRPVLGAAILALSAVALGVLQAPHSLIGTLLPVYTLALGAMGWRAMARGCRCRPCWAGRVGAALFMLSDFILAYDMFNAPLPYRKLLVMSTYYSAQLGISLTVLSPQCCGV